MKNTGIQIQILHDALHLPAASRAFIAEKLLESLDAEPGFTISEEWEEEILRRCEEIDNGTATLIPAEEAFEQAFKAIG